MIITSVKKENNKSDQITDIYQENIITLPTELIVKSKMGNELLFIDSEAKNLFAYNITTYTNRPIISVNNKNYFFKTIASNQQWIVWIEDDSLISDLSENFNWQLVAYNTITNEFHVIEKSEIKSADYEAPDFINKVPEKIYISKENKLAYIFNKPNGTTVSSHIILFDLNNKSKKIIASTKDVDKEWLYDCSIYGNYVVWNKLVERNYDNQFRMSNYKYSDLYLYRIDKGITKQLTDKAFYYSPRIYNETLATINMPLTRPNQVTSNTEITLMNVIDKTIQTIVDDNSEVNNKIRGTQLLRDNPKINSKYISWYNSGFDNMFVYNYLEKDFVKVYDYDSDPGNNTTIWDMFDDYVLIYVNRTNGNSLQLLIKLP